MSIQRKRLILLTTCFTAFVSVSLAGVRPAKRGQSSSTLPARIVLIRELPYASSHERQKLNLYLPENSHKRVSLIVWVHGGGWNGGDKDHLPSELYSYVQDGFAVASINYRLSGDAVFPAQIEDCKAAIRWLRAHAKEYALDSKHFGVWGNSAGGHLVALLGTSGDVREFDSGEHLQYSSRVQAVVDYCGPTDLTEYAVFNEVASQITVQLFGGPVSAHQDKARLANPITHVSKDDPPFLIVHGDRDSAVPLVQSQLFFEALKKGGVSVRLHIVKDAGHEAGFGNPEASQMVRTFFKQQLMSKAPAVHRK